MTAKDLYYEFYIAGTPDQVWQAIVSPEGVSAILWGSRLETTFEVGSDFRYVGPGNAGPETVHVYGKILEYEEGRTLSMTHFPGETYHPGKERYESRMTYKIEPAGPVTKLTFVHDRWDDNDPSYANTPTAWWLVLCSIKTYVETGKPLPMD